MISASIELAIAPIKLIISPRSGIAMARAQMARTRKYLFRGETKIRSGPFPTEIDNESKKQQVFDSCFQKVGS